MSRRSGRVEELYPEPGCNLACSVCDCRLERREHLDRTLDLGGFRLEIRGEAASMKSLSTIVARAREAGWSRIAVRTNGVGFASAQRLTDLGVDEVFFFLASERPEIHDAIARVRGAHAAGLRGLRSIASAGLPITLEMPVLARKLVDLGAAIASVADQVRAVRLFSPDKLWEGAGPPPRELAPPLWSEARANVANAIAIAEKHGLPLTLGERDGIPICGALGADEVREILPERSQRPIARGSTSRLGARCSTCAVSGICPGVTDRYLATHGDAGLEPRSGTTRGLEQIKVRPDALWSDGRRASAQASYMAVVRPTVDCNQDCWFCSANETSRNVEQDVGRMARKIVRLARVGTRHISFSGGEPTLSRHLLHYVQVARDAGIPTIELVTNAALLDSEQKVDAYAAAGVTNLFVSLHGHDEATSRAQTRKVGDHARTTRALELFATRTQAIIRLNHVVTARNYRALVRFVEWVSARFGTRISISFAYLTPQYKALDRLGDVMPRYREVVPYLKKALARAAELEIECVVGSRQGMPPCTLDQLAIFSDVAAISNNALAEDTPQKIKAESCKTCRFDAICTGVWKPYAELYGLDELKPVLGEPIVADEDLATALGVHRLPSSADMIIAPEAPTRVHLDVLHHRPLRVVIVGSGARALRILAAANEAGLAVIGVASPHLLEKEVPEITVDRAAKLDDLLSKHSVDAVIVASATPDHAVSARAAIARGLPVLIEKPIASGLREARALVEEGGALLTAAHQMRMAPGFQELLREARSFGAFDLHVRRKIGERSSESLQAWSRSSLYEGLIHLADLVIAALTNVTVEGGRSVGISRPESCEVRGKSGTGRFTISHEWQASEDELSVEAVAGSRRVIWIRRGAHQELMIVDAQGIRSRSPAPGSDLVALLQTWATSIEQQRPSPIDGSDGEAAMRIANEALEALEAAGTPFDRVGAPRHASSRELRERYD